MARFTREPSLYLTPDHPFVGMVHLELKMNGKALRSGVTSDEVRDFIAARFEDPTPRLKELLDEAVRLFFVRPTQ